MTHLSSSEGCRLLAIDPKTLCQWLALAQMSLHTHPTDARVKCLTSQHVHALASLHGRTLQLQAWGLVAEGASPEPDKAESRMLSPPPSDVDLQERLVQMEAQIATLQAQRTDLALQLLQEGARTAHGAASASSGSPTHLDRRSRSGSALWFCTLRVAPARNVSVGLPSH